MNDPSHTPPADLDGNQPATNQISQQPADMHAIRNLLQATLDASLDMIQVFQALRNEQGQIIDFIWVLNNHTSEKIYGDVIGKRLLQHNPGVVEVGIFDTFKTVVETGIPDQQERHYVHEQFNGWFYQSTVKLGDGVATTTTDITDRKKAEQEILNLKDEVAQRVTNKYESIFNAIDEGFCIYEVVYNDRGEPSDLRWLEVNPTYEKQTGLKDVVGKLHSELGLATESSWFDLYDNVIKTGQSVHVENWHGPTSRWYHVYASRIGGADSQQVAVVFEDITNHKLREQQQTFLLSFADAVRPLIEPEQIQAVACRLLGIELGASRVNYAEVYGADYTVANEFLMAGLPSMKGRYPINSFRPEEINAFRAGKTVVISDIAAEPGLPNAAEAYEAIHVRAFISVPIVKVGQLMFVLSVIKSEPYLWSQCQIALAEEIAERTWAAVERAKAEAALAKSEERLQLATDAAQIGTFIYYPQEDRGEPDAQMLALYGLPPDTTLNLAKALTQIIYPDDRQRYAHKVAQALNPAGSGKLDTDVRIVHPDGSVHWMNVRGQVVFDNGQAVRMPGVSTDITQRKRHEQQQAFLLEFSDTLRTLAHKPTIEQTSLQLLAKYLGLDRTYIATVYRQEDRAVIGPEYRRAPLGLVPIAGELHMSDFPEGFRQVEDQTLVVHHIATDATLSERDRQSLGAIQLTALVVASVRKGERDVVWSLVASTTTPRQWTADEVQLIEMVAERTWAAGERAQAEAALQASQQRFESIANLVPDLLWESRPDGSTTWYNQRWLAYTGQRFEEAIGWGWTDAIHPDDRAASTQRYGEAVAVRGALRQEHRIRRYDGEYRWFMVSTDPFRDPAGQVIKMYGAATDIDELKRLETSLREADRRKDEFMAMLAHELRNPLAPVRNGLQLLAQTHPDDPTLGTLLPIINRQMDHLMRMLDDLLNVSRISRGKMELHTQRMNLTQVVAQAVEAMRPSYTASNRQLQAQLPDHPIYLDGDPTRIHQVVTNLLTNGVRYTHEGGTVWLSLEQFGQQAVLRVSDNGIGLAADQLAAIFGLFVQVNTSLARSHGGLGLGLALVQQLVQLHGGRIEAHSEGLDQGSEFVVHLPILPA